MNMSQLVGVLMNVSHSELCTLCNSTYNVNSDGSQLTHCNCPRKPIDKKKLYEAIEKAYQSHGCGRRLVLGSKRLVSKGEQV